MTLGKNYNKIDRLEEARYAYLRNLPHLNEKARENFDRWFDKWYTGNFQPEKGKIRL